VRQGSCETGHGPVSLSNRRETCPESGHSVGLDRVSVSFKLDDHCPDLTAWNSVRVSNPGTDQEAQALTAFVPLDGGHQAMIGAQFIPGTGEWVGKAEFNPSRVIDPDGHSLCPPEALPSILDQVRERASGLVAANGSDWMHANAKRLDVTRDFEGIARPAALLSGLATVHRPWSRKNNLFNDASRAGAQTLSVGGGQSGVNLYDKHAETKGAVPVGTLRWEARCRSGWLDRYGGIKHMEDITTAGLEALAMDRFDWSGMGAEVSAADEVVERVLRSGLTPTEQERLLGYLLCVSVGREPSKSRTTAAKFRRYARQLGIALDPSSLLGNEDQFTARLDWASGTEVLHVAA
jgi:hypothetical protein